ncbi:MAG: hypothetical protein VW270_04205 [Candidatus Poseidoniales archaeon]
MEKISQQLYEEINRVANAHLYEGAKPFLRYDEDDIFFIQHALSDTKSKYAKKFSTVGRPLLQKMDPKAKPIFDVNIESPNEIKAIHDALVAFKKNKTRVPKKVDELILKHAQIIQRIQAKKLGTTKQIN